MNEPLIVRPTDPPVTLYVVAVLYVKCPALSRETMSTGYKHDERLEAIQFTRPGEHPLSDVAAAHEADRQIRAAAPPPGVDWAHYRAKTANVNATVIKPAP